MKSVLLLGASGQLGSLVAKNCPDQVTLIPESHQSLDISDKSALVHSLDKARPDVVINCAAYTAVDRAEHEQEEAFKINAEALASLASLVPAETKIVHISTDFVFSKASARPYKPTDTPAPTSVYGASKLAGEHALQESHNNNVILRTSWLYSASGANFVNTMLKVMQDKPELNVVNDQIGSPTSAHRLAEIIWQLVAAEDAKGIYHWSDRGVISWYDFAVEIYTQAREQGLVRQDVKINPVSSEDYKRDARRPDYSALDITGTEALLGIEASPWQEELGKVLKTIREFSN